MNGIKSDNFLCNLSWSTYEENNQHAFDIGLNKKGVEHSKSKLKDFEIKDIRESELSNRKLAKIYFVSPETISCVKKRKTWKHIE